MKSPVFMLALILLLSCRSPSAESIKIQGETKQWHKITLLVEGPETSESASKNPFLDYRLDVTFSKGGRSVVVPGYFAADGIAAESSASEGNVWKVHFRPDDTGIWNYRVSFLEGRSIAVQDRPVAGQAVGPHGQEGSIEVFESERTEPDLRARGRIVNGGKGYFCYQDDRSIWIKNGADSPENFLAFHEFDQTYRFALKAEVREGEADPKKDLHQYRAHLDDWKDGDPTWKDGLGKGIIGAVNYLHSMGINSIYMLTMNILGDGKDVWPYKDHNERTRFDCSKLDQWEVVFDHMESLGMMQHFVLQETENEVLLDNGYTDVQRRIYLRELLARFGHHLAVTWNLGEENGATGWSPVGQTDRQRMDMASYIKSIAPYPALVALHTHSNDHHQDLYLEPLLGFEDLDGPSMQIGNPFKVHERVLHWVDRSEEAGLRWTVCLDEIGQHWKGVMPDSHDPAHDTVRAQCLWGSLMAGATGVEWYFGYRYPHTDLTCEDFRSRENWWKQSGIATEFMQQFPLDEMVNMDHLVSSNGAYCLAKPGELYIVYLPSAAGARMNLDTGEGLELFWFNPREGGALQKGSVSKLTGAGNHGLGQPPAYQLMDWLVVIK